MNRRAAIAIALLLASHAAAVAADDMPRVVPNPASLERLPGSFALTVKTLVMVPRGDAAAQRAADILIDRIRRSGGPQIADTRADPREGEILLERDASLRGEAYGLDVTPHGVRLRAGTAEGLMHAGTTLWQLIADAHARPVLIPAVRIDDAPRFPWRGLMLDSARHYQSPEFILRFIDAMSAQKLNVLHWHLTDDQAWRLEIRKYPRLTSIGAWRVPAGPAAHADIDARTGKPRLYGGFYSRETARRIVAYAADRGITVVPEIEMPGHASAVLAAYPEFGAAPPAARDVPADWGVYPNVYNLDERTLAFMRDVLEEVMEIFPSTFVHIGGDEVQKAQWSTSPRVHERMRELGIAGVDGIQPWLTRYLADILAKRGRRLVGWDEILEGSERAALPATAVVMSWRGMDGALAAVAKGRDTVLAAHPTLYFDNRQSAAVSEPPGRAAVVSLEDVYRFEPMPAQIAASQRHHVLGLQANIWTEHVRTEERVGWMAFPRAAAVAEVGWSQPERRDWNDFRRRLAAMPARYESLGMTYAKGTFSKGAATPSPSARTSRELELCSDRIALALEDDAPIEGPRAVFLADIMNPCWIWRHAPLDGVVAIEARVGQVPFNFQIGDDVKGIRLAKPVTAEGELEVHADTCEGDLVARLPLGPALASQATTMLPPARIAPSRGDRDLCLRFAQPALDPLWLLDSVRLVRAP